MSNELDIKNVTDRYNTVIAQRDRLNEEIELLAPIIKFYNSENKTIILQPEPIKSKSEMSVALNVKPSVRKFILDFVKQNNGVTSDEVASALKAAGYECNENYPGTMLSMMKTKRLIRRPDHERKYYFVKD